MFDDERLGCTPARSRNPDKHLLQVRTTVYKVRIDGPLKPVSDP
jgi:hypothetical protein